MTTSINSFSVDDTRAAGAKFAQQLCAGDVVSIDGDLGAGKTEFVRGIVSAFSDIAQVTSPTFSIINTYQTEKFPIHHFDFYRIDDVRELSNIGFDEYVFGDGVCLIEWGEKFVEVLPDYKKNVCISNVDDGVEREICF